MILVFGSLDTSSRIIQNDDYYKMDFLSNGGSKNYNKMCLEYFLVKYDYKNNNKLNIVNYIEDKFTGYIDRIGYNSNGMVLYDEKNFLVNFPYKYCDRYRGKIERRMRYLCYKEGNKNCVFLTLTIDPKRYDSFVDMWIEIKKQLNRFMTRVKIENKKRNNYNIKYLSSIECQHGEKSWMNPHIHIVFMGVKRIMDWRLLRDYWKLGHIWINRTSDGKKIRKPIDYLTKYITKTYDATDKYNIRDQAVQWFFGVRSFSYSKGLLYPLNYSMKNNNLVCSVYCDSEYIFNWFSDNCDEIMNNYDYFGFG